MSAYQIAVLPGDGIGPEVTREAERAILAAADEFNFEVKLERWPIGGTALDQFDTPFPDATRDACLAADAVFLGAIGGPKWDHETGSRRCEAALLSLRKALGGYANLRPVIVPESLVESSPLRAERVAGTDLLIVRELTGGIYFGTPRSSTEEKASNAMVYSRDEIERIVRTAFDLARKRRGRLTSVDKANVLEVSQLWRSVVTEIHNAEFSDVELEHLYIDNAAIQLILRPSQFDVIVTGNLFGDILSDLAGTLPGSLGILPSASIGGKVGLFEPVHGSAPDIVGKGYANPAGALLSAVMLLQMLGETEAGARIQHGVVKALEDGILTYDLGGTASTVEFSNAVLEHAFTISTTTV
ncbi:MAG: 3-isopropylmalate dehydrogenase [Rhodothermaceae bacterium]|nr:3-isopropylmalate dehydrogenase [Bacteroidota bacterium]MXW14854.1 3-isopropylmalate dehydrogenase [Rhodothermaceae bacterium]MXW32413.1 3-isopropylmalate dehydrogenase [Rhodothermaceae bacterium]MXX97404.1 3-isopropylmalate dehydrogenase [Rhodothermaceae bacterium]MXZ59004.1 3-isopropylmalate dehydrogenase [Rhodothermaceae bacterium]